MGFFVLFQSVSAKDFQEDDEVKIKRRTDFNLPIFCS